MKKLSVLLAILLAGFAYGYLHRPLSYPPGVLVESEPQQIALSDGETPIEHGEYQSPPIPKEQIISHSTNLHVIPATPAIASFCKSVRQGELVHLEGELVEATGPEIGTWRSSLTRTDTGNGACELMLVEDCSKLSPPVKKPTTLVRR